MSLTSWTEVVGHKCVECNGYATHIYGNVFFCCMCHGGELILPNEAKHTHENYLRRQQKENQTRRKDDKNN